MSQLGQSKLTQAEVMHTVRKQQSQQYCQLPVSQNLSSVKVFLSHRSLSRVKSKSVTIIWHRTTRFWKSNSSVKNVCIPFRCITKPSGLDPFRVYSRSPCFWLQYSTSIHRDEECKSSQRIDLCCCALMLSVTSIAHLLDFYNILDQNTNPIILETWPKKSMPGETTMRPRKALESLRIGDNLWPCVGTVGTMHRLKTCPPFSEKVDIRLMRKQQLLV